MDEASQVSRKQIAADLTREIFDICGEKFKSKDVEKIEEYIKNSIVENDSHLKHIYKDAVPGGTSLDEKEYQGWLKLKGRIGWQSRLVVVTKNGDIKLNTPHKAGVKLERSCSLNEIDPLPSPRRKRNFTRSHHGIDVGLDEIRKTRSDSGDSVLTLWAPKPTDLDMFEEALKRVSKKMKSVKLNVRKSALVQNEVDRIMQAMSRTNSGGDPYAKVMSLFPCTGTERYFVRARKKAEKDTQVHIAATHAVIFTFNTFDVQFRDEMGSPLEKEILEVSTVLMEIVSLGTNRLNRRFMQIKMPDVETIGDLIDVLGVPVISSPAPPTPPPSSKEA